MGNNFRKTIPARTYSGKQLKPYRKYKLYLREDFQKRCGYTDCPEIWFGGQSNFHIDHFLPKSIHPHLEFEYSNLVYSCSFVNRAKSDDEGDYLDPCNVDYNEHFERDDFGNIVAKSGSKEAVYMIRKLKLYLKRYGIIWMLENLRDKIKLISEALEKVDSSEAHRKAELLELSHELSREFQNYLDYLEIEMN